MMCYDMRICDMTFLGSIYFRLNVNCYPDTLCLFNVFKNVKKFLFKYRGGFLYR